MGGSIVGLRLSQSRGNVRLSVQRKCHLVMPRWYQMMTPWEPPGIAALEDPRHPGISWWCSGGFPIPARLLEAISPCASLSESPSIAPAGGRSACARRRLWVCGLWPRRQRSYRGRSRPLPLSPAVRESLSNVHPGRWRRMAGPEQLGNARGRFGEIPDWVAPPGQQ